MEDIDESLEGNNLCTIHKLSMLLGSDRRTIGKRLSGVEPDQIKGFAIRQRLLQLVNLSLGEARIASEGQLP